VGLCLQVPDEEERRIGRNIERIRLVVNGNFVLIVPVFCAASWLRPEWAVDGAKGGGIFLQALQDVMGLFSGAA